MKEIVFDEATIRKALQIPVEVPIIFKDNCVTVQVVPTPIKEVPLGKWFRHQAESAKRVECSHPILHGNIPVKNFYDHPLVYSKLSEVDVYVIED